MLPGEQIGNGVIVGAGAVVRRAIPAYAIVTGNPGTVLRYRFAPHDIVRLQRLAWWNWPTEAVAQAETALMPGDISALENCQP